MRVVIFFAVAAVAATLAMPSDPLGKATDVLLDKTALVWGVPTARVELVSGSTLPSERVTGVISIEQWTGHVRIHGKVRGLKRGLHGLHVHAVGDVSFNCNNAGTHFNPEGVNHGARCGVHFSSDVPKPFPFLPTVLYNCGSNNSHAGDLGNLKAGPLGYARIDIVDNSLTLGDGGARDINGRSLVIHSNADDLGRGKDFAAAESRRTGNAGGRVACGLISLTFSGQ